MPNSLPSSGDIRRRALAVLAFAAAMAWVESAVVFYLRRLVGRIEPYQANPLPMIDDLGWVELVREAATMIMLLGVAWLAGRTPRARFGYFVAAFGAWDIFYYIFLIPMTGWPHSLLDWDILFLIPLPWWGPVLAPVMIALLMIVGGLVLTGNDTRADAPFWPSRAARIASAVGIAFALYAFMADAIRAVQQGQPVQAVLPRSFNWPLFLVAWALMAVPAFGLLRQVWRQRAGKISLGAIRNAGSEYLPN